MMMMKSIFPGIGNRSTRRKPDQEDPEEYPVENLPGNIWPIDGPKSLNVSSITTRCRYHQYALGRRDSAVWRSALWWHRREAASRDVIIRSLLSVTSCPGVSTEKVD